MSYELQINAGVQGGPSIDAASASTAKLDAATSGLNNALYGASAAQEKYTLGAQKLAIEQARIEQLTIRYNIALLENARSSTTAAAGQEALAASTGRVVGQTMAASSALRVMEGAMPLRAAASFLGSIQGIGTAMQLMFPLFGAIALVEVLDKIIGKVAEWANAHDPIIQAQTLSLSLLKQEGQEYDRLAKKAQEYNDKKFGDKFGAAALDRLQSSRFSRAAAEDGRDIGKLADIQTSLAHIAQLADAGKNNPKWEDGLTAADRQVASRLQSVLREDPKYKTQLTGMESLANRGLFLNPNFAGDAARDLSVGVGAVQERAAMQRQSDQNDAEAKAADGVKKDAQTAAEAARKAKESAARLASIQSKAYDSQMTRLGFGSEYAALSKDAAETERQVKEDPKNEAAIRSSHAIMQAGIMSEARKKASTGMDEFRDSLPPTIRVGKDPNALEEEHGFMQDQMRAGGLFAGQLLTGNVSGAEQLRLARTGASRGLQLTQRAARDQDPSHAANNEYGARLAGINAVYSAEDRLAKTEQEHADAKATKEQALFEASMQREEALQAIIDKQKEAARSLAGGLFDAIHSHSTSQWTRAFGVGQEKALFENIASIPIGSISKSLGGAVGGQTDAAGNPTFLGNLLHGTVLSSANADPAKATQENTKLSADWLQKIYGKLSGHEVRNPSDANPGSDGGSGGGDGFNLGDLSNLPTSGAPSLGTLLGIAGGGTASLSKGIGGAASALASLLFTPLAPAGTVGWNPDTGAADDQYGHALQTVTPPGTVGWNPDTGAADDDQGNPIAKQGSKGPTPGAIAAAAAVGIFNAVQSFSRGGAGGALGGASSLLGAAAVIPVLTPFAAPLAAATGILGSLLSTSPAQRAQQFTNDIAKNQYLAPTALNVSQGMNGTYQSFDARGNIQTSTMRALPTVAEPYITTRELNGSQSWYDAPGNVTQPYQGGAHGTGQNPVSNAPGSTGGSASKQPVIIMAMDAQSFTEFADKNHKALGEAVATHLQNHEGRLSNQIRYVAGS